MRRAVCLASSSSSRPSHLRQTPSSHRYHPIPGTHIRSSPWSVMKRSAISRSPVVIPATGNLSTFALASSADTGSPVHPGGGACEGAVDLPAWEARCRRRPAAAPLEHRRPLHRRRQVRTPGRPGETRWRCACPPARPRPSGSDAERVLGDRSGVATRRGAPRCAVHAVVGGTRTPAPRRARARGPGPGDDAATRSGAPASCKLGGATRSRTSAPQVDPGLDADRAATDAPRGQTEVEVPPPAPS